MKLKYIFGFYTAKILNLPNELGVLINEFKMKEFFENQNKIKNVIQRKYNFYLLKCQITKKFVKQH